MKTPLRLAPWWWALALALPAWAGPPGDALRAANPDTAVPPARLAIPPAQRLDPPETPADLAAARALWREVNQRVAEFPRGHIDLLRWETERAPGPATASSAPAPDPAPLGLRDVLQASLRHRPDLFTQAGMNALEQARVRVAFADHVRTVQHTWIAAITARERLRLREAVLDASRQGSELGRRMVAAGNWPAARLMQEQAIEASAWQATVESALVARDAVDALAGLMGVWSADAAAALGARLPEALPAPPERLDPANADGVEAAVLRADPVLALDRETARRAIAALPDGRWAAWSQARDAALQALPDPATAEVAPPHIADLGLLRDARLQEADEQRARLLARATERRAMARAAWSNRHARHALALHAQDTVAALKDGLQQESQRRYNGMFDSTWQLLAASRERLDALDAALQARSAWWRAQANWQALLAGAPHQPEAGPGATAPASIPGTGGH